MILFVVILLAFIFAGAGYLWLQWLATRKEAYKEAHKEARKAHEEERPKAPRPVDLREALSKTRDSFWGRIHDVFIQPKALSGEYEELEEVLYTSDLGPQTVQTLLAAVQEKMANGEPGNLEVVRNTLKAEMLNIFQTTSLGDGLSVREIPSVWMIVGVNGAGKTTTIGKLAAQLAQEGKKVLVAAGDTFRAAAGEQLRVWTGRAQVEIFDPSNVKDPSAVAFDAVQKAVSDHYDIVLIDTAGRLHTAKNLMEELKKMKRVIQKVLAQAPHEVLLVLDANSGQNALQQAREFHSALGVTGVILTKLDGSAKGGVAVGVACELHLPIRLIGVGEKLEDLRVFAPGEFVDSIL